MNDNHPSLSFEVFPPNTQIGTDNIVTTLDQLQNLKPHFISVTCSNNKSDFEKTTLKLADYINNTLDIPAIAHLPAAYLSANQVKRILTELDSLNIHQVLALRGDIIPRIPRKNDFNYASDLIKFVRAQEPSFEISGACYPEIHPESPNLVSDIHYLKQKVDVGCNQLITQLFFDNDKFFAFKENCALAGINIPIIAGIMPITNRKQALRLIKTTSAHLPKKFMAIFDKYENDPESLRTAGLAYAVDQIADLITRGAAGIHLYTMNHAETALSIQKTIGSLFKTNNKQLNNQ
ncbi:methylenetetrahydrofolate reductase [NAD(P)H] [Liquorilactobacillus aquaticus]|uniref:methylenetetrahydrofolate reductase [NAD(P)H] n=1 Tax=Liquorilactobacillus aquaticus TaxID=392566 RepID=UPI0007108C08|nr:methylenetetrahydrofolate reductase [NAD(P)H] [Liquorilactobacillus aquaticus]